MTLPPCVSRPGRRWRAGVRLSVLMVGALVVAGCAVGADVANPALRKATWYSFLNGDDLRAACLPHTPGARVPDRLRLVFNGVYAEEVRIYEVREAAAAPAPAAAAAVASGVATPTESRLLALRVIRDAPVTLSFGAEDPGAVFDPWRGQTAVRPLPPADWSRLLASLRADGLMAPAPAGTQLDSTRFYWVASGCLAGEPVFQAWTIPPGAGPAGHPAFARLLAAWPGLALPLPVYQFADRGSFDAKRRDQFRFRLRVGEDGLIDRGVVTLAPATPPAPTPAPQSQSETQP